jgi:hypothetical protein
MVATSGRSRLLMARHCTRIHLWLRQMMKGEVYALVTVEKHFRENDLSMKLLPLFYLGI